MHYRPINQDFSMLHACQQAGRQAGRQAIRLNEATVCRYALQYVIDPLICLARTELLSLGFTHRI